MSIPQLSKEQLAQLAAWELDGLTCSIAAEVVQRLGATVVTLPDGRSRVSALGSETVRRLVRGGILKMRGYGLDTDDSLTATVLLMFRIAPNFDQHPAINRILTDPRFSADVKVNLLGSLVPARVWRSASAGYDPRAWHASVSEEKQPP